MRQTRKAQASKVGYFAGNRICRVCGCNIDILDLDILRFFHSDCWRVYRMDGELYPMPKYAG